MKQASSVGSLVKKAKFSIVRRLEAINAAQLYQNKKGQCNGFLLLRLYSRIEAE
jgi:hypothetical protein